jgi:hypothetical protein
MDKKFWIMFALAQAKGVAELVKNMDVDNKGVDDLMGRVIIPLSADAVSFAINGNVRNADAILAQIEQSIHEYRQNNPVR